MRPNTGEKHNQLKDADMRHRELMIQNKKNIKGSMV